MTYRRWCGLCGTYVYAGDKAPCDGDGRSVNACPLSEPGDVEFVPNKEALKARQDAENRANREALMVAQRQFHQEPFKAPFNPAPTPKELEEFERTGSVLPIKSDGGSTSYYELPEDASELNDLIEHKRMPFALGNIFKACYRLGEKDGADVDYDLNKIIYFANRLKALNSKRGSIR